MNYEKTSIYSPVIHRQDYAKEKKDYTEIIYARRASCL